ncbi:MAG: tetratricopeptide repeat protein [Vicingaceae bacterium]
MKIIQKQPKLFLLLILLLGLGLYWPSLDFDFLANFDDDKLITQSAANQSLEKENLKALFTESVFGLYHPITSLTWAIEHHFYGFNAKWFHLTNLLWHLLNAVLVFFLSRQFIKRSDWSLLISLLFVLHPMHTENVVWLSARKDLVYGCFFLLGLLTYLKFLKTQKPLHYALMVLAFLASLFSKSNAVVFPAVLIIIDLYENQNFKWKYLFNKLPLFILSGVFVFITLKTQQEAGFINSFEGEYNLFDRLLMGVYSLAYYLFCLLVPFDLSPKNLYPTKSNGWIPWVYYAAPFFLAGVAYLLYRMGKKEKLIWFGAAFFLVIIAPVLKLIPTGNDIVSNRYVYLPYLGLYLGLGLYFFKHAPKWGRYVLAAWVVALSTAAFQYQSNYEDSYTLWTKIIEENENNQWGKAMALNERGQVQMKAGQGQAAFRDIQKALELEPTLARGLMNRAVIYDKSGQAQKALNDLNKLLSENRESVDALKLRGVVYGKLNQVEKAIVDFSRALELAPKNTELLNNRGIAYSIKGENQKALADFNQALDLQPLAKQFRINRGNLYVKMGEREKALADYQWVYKKEPNSLAVAYPLAKMYFESGQSKKAKEILRPFEAKQQKASELANRLAADSLAKESLPYYTIAMGEEKLRDQSLYQRAQAYKQLGETQNAIDDLIAILENLPNPQIFFEIGNLYWEKGEAEKACEFWKEGAMRKHAPCQAMLDKHCN